MFNHFVHEKYLIEKMNNQHCEARKISIILNRWVPWVFIIQLIHSFPPSNRNYHLRNRQIHFKQYQMFEIEAHITTETITT